MLNTGIVHHSTATTMLGIVQDRAAANWTGSNVGLHSPSASICTETLRACAPGAPVSTSIPGKEPPPIVAKGSLPFRAMPVRTGRECLSSFA